MPAEAPTLSEAWNICRHSPHNQAAWRTLMRLCDPVVQPVVRSAAHRYSITNVSDQQDLVQDIHLKIALFVRSQQNGFLGEGDGGLNSWLRAVAANAVCDWLRGRLAQKRGPALTVSLDEHLQSLHLACGSNEPDRNVLFSQMNEMLPKDEKQRTIFWLYYRQGLTAAEIAAIPAFGLTAKGVESLLHRLTANLRQQFGDKK